MIPTGEKKKLFRNFCVFLYFFFYKIRKHIRQITFGTFHGVIKYLRQNENKYHFHDRIDSQRKILLDVFLRKYYIIAFET